MEYIMKSLPAAIDINVELVSPSIVVCRIILE